MDAWVCRKNLIELLLTRKELSALTSLLKALSGLVGSDLETVLDGCYVRICMKGVYSLHRISGCQLDAVKGTLSLLLEGMAKPVSVSSVSATNPLQDDTVFESTGREELQRLEQKLAVGGGRAVINRVAAAGAAWRRKVLLAWAPKLEEYRHSLGLGKLVADLNHLDRLNEQASSLEPLVPWPPPLPPEHLIAQQQQVQQQQPPQQQLPVPALVGQQPAALSEQRLAAGVVPPSRDPRAWPAQPAAHEPTLLLPGAAAQGAAAPQQPDLAQQPAFLGDILQQLAQELAGSGRTGGGEAGPAALLPALSMDLERSGSGVELSELTVSGLPRDATHGGVATFFRSLYPSVYSARILEPAGTAVVRFRDASQRDAALSKVPGHVYSGCVLSVALPGTKPPAKTFDLFVSGMHSTACGPTLAAFFRERYPSVLGARVLPGVAQAFGASAGEGVKRRGFVRFGEPSERDAALREEVSWMGNPLTLELPRQGARQGQEQQQAGGGGAFTCAEPASLYILNVGSALSPEQLRNYFKERYASVVSAKIASSGIGVVHFTSVDERQRAREEMDGHVLPGGRKIGTGLPPGSESQAAAAPPLAAAADTAVCDRQAPAEAPVPAAVLAPAAGQVPGTPLPLADFHVPAVGQVLPGAAAGGAVQDPAAAPVLQGMSSCPPPELLQGGSFTAPQVPWDTTAFPWMAGGGLVPHPGMMLQSALRPPGYHPHQVLPQHQHHQQFQQQQHQHQLQLNMGNAPLPHALPGLLLPQGQLAAVAAAPGTAGVPEPAAAAACASTLVITSDSAAAAKSSDNRRQAAAVGPEAGSRSPRRAGPEQREARPAAGSVRRERSRSASHSRSRGRDASRRHSSPAGWRRSHRERSNSRGRSQQRRDRSQQSRGRSQQSRGRSFSRGRRRAQQSPLSPPQEASRRRRSITRSPPARVSRRIAVEAEIRRRSCTPDAAVLKRGSQVPPGLGSPLPPPRRLLEPHPAIDLRRREGTWSPVLAPMPMPRGRPASPPPFARGGLEGHFLSSPAVMPPHLPQLFLDAGRQLRREQGLPIAVADVHRRMDQLCGPDCFRGTGTNMLQLLHRMEASGAVRLSRINGRLFLFEV